RHSVASCPSSCCVSCKSGLQRHGRRHVAGLPRGNRNASWISSRSTLLRTFRLTCSPTWCGSAHIIFCDPSSDPSGSPHIAIGRAGGLNAPRPCWRNPAHRSPRLRLVWDSVARARSALPFIGSQGKHLPTIAATSNDARHDVSPAEAVRRATARLPLLRSQQARDNGRQRRLRRAPTPRWVFRERRPKAGSRWTTYGRFLEEINSFLRE